MYSLFHNKGFIHIAFIKNINKEQKENENKFIILRNLLVMYHLLAVFLTVILDEISK